MDPRDRLLLVIDLQVVVAPGGAWELPGVEPIVDAATRLADGWRGPVRATRHRPVPDEPGTLGPFAQHGSTDELTEDASQLAPPLRHLSAVDKSGYSALGSDEIRRLALDAGGAVLCGIETDCCVLATAFDLLDEQIHTTIVTDAVHGPDRIGHDGALSCFGRLGQYADLCTVDELLAGEG